MGFNVSVISGLFSIFAWWQGGLSSQTELTVQEQQNKLLDELIVKVEQTNKTLHSINTLSKEQLSLSGELASIKELAVVKEQSADDSKASKQLEQLVEQREKAVEQITAVIEANPVNANKPRFPLYERGLKRIFPYQLTTGTKVKVLHVDYSVGMRNFTWALVEVIDG